MSTDTKGYISKKIDFESIVNFMQENKNFNKVEIGRHSFYYGDSPQETMWIDFINKETLNFRSLFIYKGSKKEIEGMFEDEGGEYISLTLTSNEESVKIMTEILEYFGGYLDVDDCDDIEAHETYIESKTLPNESMEVRNQLYNILNTVDIGYKVKCIDSVLRNKNKFIELINKLVSLREGEGDKKQD